MAKHFAGVVWGVAALVSSMTAQAAYTVTLNQVGADVVATGSGSFNLAGVPTVSPSIGAGVSPSTTGMVLGATAPIAVYVLPVSGPTAFGPGAVAWASASAGPAVGINRNSGQVGVPVGYVNGSTLGTSSATWAGQTLAGMGAAPGTYVWTWGSGPTADSYTLIVGGASNIPTLSEWGAVSLAAALGLLGFATLRRRRG